MKYFSLLILVFFVNCGGGSSSDSETVETVKFSGTLGSTLAQNKGIGDIGDISEIIALRLDNNGEFDASRTQRVPVEIDGSFSIELGKDGEWVLMTSNPNTTTLENRIGNFISLSEDNTTRLSSLPMFDATGDIDAGFLSELSNETSSTNTISELQSQFGLPSSDLFSLSRIDALSKYVKNAFLNNDPTTGLVFNYLLRYGLFFDLNVSYNTFSDVNSYPFSATNIGTRDTWIYSNHPAFLADKNLSFYAPNDVNGTVVQVSNDTAFTPSKLVDVYVASPVPAGYYKLNDGNETLAIFDFAGTSVFDEDNNFSGIIPSVKLNINADGNTTSFTIALYSFNKLLQTYEKIIDTNTLHRYMKLGWFNIGMTNSDYFYDLDFKSLSYREYNTNVTKTLSYVNGELYFEFPNGDKYNPVNVTGISITLFLSGGFELFTGFKFVP